MRKMSSRSSTLTPFLPARIGCRESQVQYSLKPAGAIAQRSPAERESMSPASGTRSAAISPRKFVGNSKPRMRTPPFQDSKLLSESEILQEEVAARTKEHHHQNKQQLHQAQHARSCTRKQPPGWIGPVVSPNMPILTNLSQDPFERMGWPSNGFSGGSIAYWTPSNIRCGASWCLGR